MNTILAAIVARARRRFSIYSTLVQLVFLILHCSLSILPTDAAEVQFLPSVPSCKTHTAKDLITAVSFPLPSTFCSGLDLFTNRPHYQVKALSNAIGSAHFASLTLAFFRYDNSDFSNLLCEHINSNTSPILILLDTGDDGSGAAKLSKCASEYGVPVTVRKLGHDIGIGVFHDKFLLADFQEAATNRLTLVAAGNPTYNSPLYVDFGLLFTEGNDAPVFNWHACVAGALSKIFAHKDLDDARALYTQCGPLNAPAGSGHVTGYQTPFDASSFRGALFAMLARANSCRILVEAFDDPYLFDLLKQNFMDGRPVSFLVDDDLFFASKYVRESERIPDRYLADADEINQFQAPAEAAGIDIRYLLTNHVTGQSSFVHGKMALAQGDKGDSRLYLGSANFTSAALTSNFETAYFFDDPALLEEVAAYFDSYWALGRRSAAMPNEYDVVQ